VRVVWIQHADTEPPIRKVQAVETAAILRAEVRTATSHWEKEESLIGGRLADERCTRPTLDPTREIRSRFRALAKPRVHRHNRVSMARMRVVARFLVFPDYRVQEYRPGPPSRRRRYSDFLLVVLFLWDEPLESTPAPIPRSRLATR